MPKKHSYLLLMCSPFKSLSFFQLCSVQCFLFSQVFQLILIHCFQMSYFTSPLFILQIKYRPANHLHGQLIPFCFFAASIHLLLELRPLSRGVRKTTMWSPLLYCGVAMVGLALLYEAYFCRWQEEDVVVDISSVWNREIRKPRRGPERVMVG